MPMGGSGIARHCKLFVRQAVPESPISYVVQLILISSFLPLSLPNYVNRAPDTEMVAPAALHRFRDQADVIDETPLWALQKGGGRIVALNQTPPLSSESSTTETRLHRKGRKTGSQTTRAVGWMLLRLTPLWFLVSHSTEI